MWFFFRMYLSLYDYQSKETRYSSGLTYLKNRVTTNQKHTVDSQKPKRTEHKCNTKENHLLQGLRLPSFKTEERARSQLQRHQWFNGRGSLHVWSQVLERHPTVCSRRPAGHGSRLHSRGEGETASYKAGLPQVGSFITREASRGALTAPSIRTVTSWGPGQVRRKASPVRGVEVTQALVGQRMYTEQENSHLEWPDHTPSNHKKKN